MKGEIGWSVLVKCGTRLHNRDAWRSLSAIPQTHGLSDLLTIAERIGGSFRVDDSAGSNNEEQQVKWEILKYAGEYKCYPEADKH